MPEQVSIPKVGFGVSEGVLTQWIADDGTFVEVDDLLYVLETDKAEVEQVAESSGWLKQVVAEGTTVQAGQLVGWLAAGESELADLSTSGLASGEAPSQDDVQPAAADLGPSTTPDVRSGLDRIRATPKARRIAAEAGVDLATIVGGGPDGQIRVEDVEAALAQRPGSSEADHLEIPLTGWRRSIANRLLQSVRETAQLTTIREIDISALVARREALKAKGDGDVPSLTACMLRAAALALREFPELNGTLEDDVIRRPSSINVSVAVETDRGVVTPVLREADERSPSEIQKFIVQMAGAARTGKLSPEDVTGGSFTITTTGADGADWGTPILNYPQIAILLTGRVRKVAALVDNELKNRHVMGMSLTYDHRAVDGVPTVRYIVRIEELCADPDQLLGLD